MKSPDALRRIVWAPGELGFARFITADMDLADAQAAKHDLICKKLGLDEERRARVWQLYMSGSINGFLDAGLQLHQTLGVKAIDGRSAMPPTRNGWG